MEPKNSDPAIGDPSGVSDQPTVRGRKLSEKAVGFWMAITSALSYTIALTMLRNLTNYPEVSSDWSIAVKELTTVACVTPIILVLWLRGKYRFPNRRVLWWLFFAGVTCELIGARSHLAAYAAIGLALSTPIFQACQLLLSSAIGSLWLKERLTKTKAFALATLVTAIVVLGFGSEPEATVGGRPIRVPLGLVLAFLTALGYSLQLSSMRRVLRAPQTERDASGREIAESTNPNCATTAPTTLTMVMITGLGALICGAVFSAQHEWSEWLAPPAACWRSVLIAGVANMVGFYFQIESLRRLYLLKQTMIANAQTVLLAIFGFVFFHETFNLATCVGIALVVVGVAVAGFSKD